MKENKIKKIESIKEYLTERGIYFTEHANGHLKIGTINLWAISEKWQDAEVKGVGIMTLMKHLKEQNLWNGSF